MPGARHQRRGRHAAGDQRFQELSLFADRHRIGFAVGAEHRKAGAARLEQPAAMAHEALGVGRVVLLERGDDGREHALDSLDLVAWFHGCPLRLLPSFWAVV